VGLPDGTNKFLLLLNRLVSQDKHFIKKIHLCQIVALRVHTQPDAMVAYLNPSPVSDPTDWVDLHGEYLYNYALGQLRDQVGAEDLVQETFLAALKGRERFQGYSSERTWLTSILRHKICDHFRSKCRQGNFRCSASIDENDRFDESMLWLHDTAAECLSPSRHLDLKDFRHSLETALRTLPPRIAQAFTMYDMEECPSTEVCQRLDISEGNLWTMVHRARKQLRQHLSSWRNEINDSSHSC